jgi:serine/threonine-protein kinase
LVADPFDAPMVCGHYRVLARIGSGAMGTVYEAVDTRLGRLVALKRLHPHIAEHPSAAKRFLREGRAVARIRHPHVVQVLALGTEGDTPYLAMELLEGHDLATLLENRGRLSVAEALDYVLPVIAAVSAAHDAKVIHRDLKPSNIFVGRGPGGQPWPKVVDFGVSAILEAGDSSQGTTNEGVVGTVAYMAPEQARGISTGSYAGDQYALAVLLYECVTGDRPFAGHSAYEVMQAVQAARFDPPSSRATGIPPELDAVIKRAMSREPRQRFPTMRAFGAALLPMATDRARWSWSSELQSPMAAAPVESKPRKGTKAARRKPINPSITATIDSARPPIQLGNKHVARDGSWIASYDGIALASRGDLVTVLWKAPARSARTRWFFDEIDLVATRLPDGFLLLIIVLPTWSPPDRNTAVEAAARLVTLSPAMRKTAAVVVGGSLWQTLTRGVLRVLMPTLGRDRLIFPKDVAPAIARLLRAAGPKTPSSAAIESDVRALYAALDPTLARDG